MTMDKSLRVRRGMARSRSVLTRAERLVRLKEAEKRLADLTSRGK